MKKDNFYRRDPKKALSGMIGLSLEERGVYNTVIDLLYDTWRPLEDDRRFLAGWCGCAVQKLNPIVERLLAKGRLVRFEERGRWFISDEAFEDERNDVKGAAGTRSGRGKVEEKSGEVGEKSAGVEENPALLPTAIEENQSVTALEKRREEKTKKEAIASSVAPMATTGGGLFEDEPEEPKPKAEPWERSPAFTAFWQACTQTMRTRGKSKAKVWPPWKAAVSKIGPDRLLASLKRYVAEDADVQRTGGPGAHIWLNDGTWDQWLPAEGAASGASLGPRFPGPADVRAAVVAAKGEDWTRAYLDPSGWRDVPARAITATKRFVLSTLEREVGDVMRRLEISLMVEEVAA